MASPCKQPEGKYSDDGIFAFATSAGTNVVEEQTRVHLCRKEASKSH